MAKDGCFSIAGLPFYGQLGSHIDITQSDTEDSYRDPWEDENRGHNNNCSKLGENGECLREEKVHNRRKG